MKRRIYPSGTHTGDDRKGTIDEASKAALNDVKTGEFLPFPGQAMRKPVYCHGGIRCIDGMTCMQASYETQEPVVEC